LLLALAGVLGSCGGSGSGASSSTQAGGTGAADGGSAKSGSGGKKSSESPKQDGGKGEGAARTSAPVAPLHVGGGGSSQFRVKGGDNSVQEFGEESSESELDEAASALHGFYVARARSEWRAACAELSRSVAGQLRILAEQGKQGNTSCPDALAAITPDLPPKVAYETTIVDAGSLRVEGDSGFLIYRGGEKTVYAINMAREDGSWKVGALAGVPIA